MWKREEGERWRRHRLSFIGHTIRVLYVFHPERPQRESEHLLVLIMSIAGSANGSTSCRLGEPSINDLVYTSGGLLWARYCIGWHWRPTPCRFITSSSSILRLISDPLLDGPQSGLLATSTSSPSRLHQSDSAVREPGFPGNLTFQERNTRRLRPEILCGVRRLWAR